MLRSYLQSIANEMNKFDIDLQLHPPLIQGQLLALSLHPDGFGYIRIIIWINNTYCKIQVVKNDIF